jgi:hypothetical protein
MKFSEESMKDAIDDVRNGMSIRAAAEKNQVAKTTLCNRLNSNGEIPVRGRPTVLPFNEEQLLVNWVLRRAIICCPVTRRELLDCVQDIYCKIDAKTSFKNNRPSMGWVNKLKVRHKLSLRRSEDLDGGRTRVITLLSIESEVSVVIFFITTYF